MPTDESPLDTKQAPVAWVTGAGSGLGQSIAVNLSRLGYHLVLSGRRLDPLEDTKLLVSEAGGTAVVRQLDVGSAQDVLSFREWLIEMNLHINVHVSSAGFNVPRRYWGDLSMGDFEDVVNVNLNGVARSASVAIDDMKANNGGTIIVISSYAGWRFVDVAGPAYSSTKLALGALVESMNSELGLRGIRATNLCPGEVFTPIFLSRPNPPSPERIAAMLTPDDVAAMVNLIVSLPPHVCVNEVVMTPLSNHFYDRSVFPQ